VGQSGTIPEHDRLGASSACGASRACEPYNAPVERRRDAYCRCGESVSRGDQQSELTAIRGEGRMLTDAEADEVVAVVRGSRG
jgi:hypothetical protein